MAVMGTPYTCFYRTIARKSSTKPWQVPVNQAPDEYDQLTFSRKKLPLEVMSFDHIYLVCLNTNQNT